MWRGVCVTGKLFNLLVSQVQQPMNITTLLTLLAAASNEHGDHTGNGEQREEADEAACNGGMELMFFAG